MSENSELTVATLDKLLHGLVNWERFALHLPEIDNDDIGKINADYDKVDKKKLALYGTWKTQYPKGTLDDVIKALKEVRENKLAEKVRQHIEQKQPKQPEQPKQEKQPEYEENIDFN